VLDLGIAALVDLTREEPPAAVPRDLVYCRFPLIDGAENPRWLLRSAIETTARLLLAHVPTLICCGAGMSRSPAIAAAAMAIAEGRPIEECLTEISRYEPHDVSPALWDDVAAVLEERKAPRAPS
jgi:protein-tyrosine phosphatase